MDFLIRRAVSADIPQLCGLLSDLFSLEADFRPDEEKQSRALELLVNDTSGASFVVVAEKGDEVVGMCSVQALISTAEGGAAGLLEDLVVRSDSRGNGIGKKLLSGISKWCAGKGISRIQLLRDLDNGTAHEFYLGQGWSDTKLVCMRKSI